MLAATDEEHLEIVKLLLDSGANPLAIHNGGDTGLHMACFQGNPELVQVSAYSRQQNHNVILSPLLQ